MKALLFVLILLVFPIIVVAQYPPAAGQLGSSAISSDSSCFVDWANQCQIVRGFLSIADTNATDLGSNHASYGLETDAIGYADNSVVSLGDAGVALIGFSQPIVDGNGFDFAVFENSFTDYFLELAFVEVSSDGINFFRFPSFSLSDTLSQVAAFGDLDPAKIHNLAGKYRGMYGMPFDLDDILDDPLLDKQNIGFVRIVDVVGSINPLYGSRDSEGRIINDPWPTLFASSGFDLDAVGVIHNQTHNGIAENQFRVMVFPNPSSDIIHVLPKVDENYNVIITDGMGRSVIEFNNLTGVKKINVDFLPNGMYFLHVFSNQQSAVISIMVQ